MCPVVRDPSTPGYETVWSSSLERFSALKGAMGSSKAMPRVDGFMLFRGACPAGADLADGEIRLESDAEVVSVTPAFVDPGAEWLFATWKTPT